ncbi:piggyBac transposable element-derived protein 4-like isoform X2 [Littorina saxatilis]|uniref:PiggyBac transposable element-derived protein domain-containing protein n=2 Tax=Littorina saxatilis TaxID=31220 RepID=A0AAN9B895_9CAEN
MERPNIFDALRTANGDDFHVDSAMLTETTPVVSHDAGHQEPQSGDDETSDEEGPLPPEGDSSPDQSEAELMEGDEQVPEASSETAKDGTEWCSAPTISKTAKTAPRNIFKMPPSKLLGCQNVNTPNDAFSLFITDKIVSDVVEFTNIEGRRVLKEAWDPVDREECQAVIGILLFLGARKQNMVSTEKIWDSVKGSGMVRACMSRRRFQNFMTYMRFDDKSTRSARREKDQFAPFRDMWTDFMKALSSHYIAGPLLTVDEQLVPFRGRCGFLQYLPSKPDRYGMKVFWVADAENAFPLYGIPYLGRPLGQDRQVNLGRNIATELATPFFKSGRNVTCDNYFTDLELAETLSKNGLTVVGTVRGNKRFLPNSFKTGRHLGLYDSEFAYNGATTVVNYQSKRRKSVILLSTMHDTGVVDRTPENQKKKPEIVLFYNATKGAVDTVDKMAHAYTVKRRTKRWPMVMFFNIIDLATIAARCVWSVRFPAHPLSKKDGRSDFIENISDQLMYPLLKQRMTSVAMPRSLHEAAEKAIKHLECDDLVKRQRKTSSKKALLPPAEDAAKSKRAGSKRPASSQDASTSGSKIKRCLFCSWRLDRKTKHTCCQCDEFICQDHTHKVCPVCIKAMATS